MSSKSYSQQEMTMDSKGRVSLTPAYRKLFGDDVVVLKWKDHLKVFSPELFEEITGFVAGRLSDGGSSVAGIFNPKNQADRRLFYSNRFDMGIDASNRLTIPKTLRSQLDLYEDVIWLGCGDYLELWAKKHYEADCARLGETGGYDELFAGSPPITPSAHNPAAGPEGDGLQ